MQSKLAQLGQVTSVVGLVENALLVALAGQRHVHRCLGQPDKENAITKGAISNTGAQRSFSSAGERLSSSTSCRRPPPHVDDDDDSASRRSCTSMQRPGACLSSSVRETTSTLTASSSPDIAVPLLKNLTQYALNPEGPPTHKSTRGQRGQPNPRNRCAGQ